MPTYQYECDACGHAFEIFQSITAQKLRKCPECKVLKLTRLIGRGSGIIFKGSGFYETDYKRSKSESGPQKEPAKGVADPARNGAGKGGKDGAKPESCPLKDPEKGCPCAPSQK